MPRQTSDPLGRAHVIICERIVAHPDFQACLQDAIERTLTAIRPTFALAPVERVEAMRALGGMSAVIEQAITETEPIEDGSSLWGTITSHTVLRGKFWTDQIWTAIYAAARAADEEAQQAKPQTDREFADTLPAAQAAQVHQILDDEARITRHSATVGGPVQMLYLADATSASVSAVWVNEDGSTVYHVSHDRSEDDLVPQA